ncbi:uncharacterized protein LOC127286590 [Leptopilina boulardi]|uniref:uncharacterized protein LOC127286590 n=1 Tax=Leptopilina boulardi TaxID=63433 RepID=UPI0021F503DA|nr:uncharacterized protein LOC127286590 [Leptopilina boulardi]
MSSSASWIKNNMLGKNSKSPKRVMSEAEMRVQKALQKLEIPEWYLNKHSKAPKILKNDTPIDYRQPSWKKGGSKQIIPEPRRTEDNADPTRVYSRDTKIVNSKNETSYLTNKTNSRTIIENQKNILTSKCKKSEQEPITLEKLQPIDISDYNNQLLSSKEDECNDENSQQKTKLGNKSNSYPKISPSRKIQNINIVLDSSPNSGSSSPSSSSSSSSQLKKIPNLDINSNMNSEIDRMTENFESTFGLNDSEIDKCITPINDKTNQSSYFNSSLVNVISPKPFIKKIGTPFMTPVSEFKIPQLSTPDTVKKRGFYTSTLERPSPLRPNPMINREQNFGLDISIPSTCDTTATSCMSTKARNGNESGKIRKDYLNSTYWIGEVKPAGMDCNKACEECGSKLPRFYAVVTKTKRLMNNLRHEKKSIIEFNEKKLKEMMTKETETEIDSVSVSGTESGSVSESDNESSNSAASLSSMSLSYKGSEIGTAKVPATSTLKSNIRSPFTKKSTTTTNKSTIVKNDVHWIPVKQEFIDRTNNILNMNQEEIEMFRRTSSVNSNSIPEKMSHIIPATKIDKNLQTFETQQLESMKKFLKHEENAILESGYSSRSLKCNDSLFDSFASSRTWFEDSVSDDTESDYSFSLKGRRAMKKY